MAWGDMMAMEFKPDERPLNKLAPGETGVVQRVVGQGAVQRRLYDMGVTPGTSIFVRKVAPLGDPMEIMIRGYELSLRKEEASNIILTVGRKLA